MIALEPATPLHATAMAAIHADAFDAPDRWGADAFALQLGLPGAFGWIAPEGGMILARVAADEAEILTLAVMPAVRRRGLAAALLRQAMETARTRGAAAMFLEVAAANQAACALYLAEGFVQAGRRRGYYREGVDALILRATIVS